MANRDPNIDGRLLKPFGLPPGPLADPLTLYRAGNTGVFHSDPACKSGRRTRRTPFLVKQAHTFIPAERGPLHLATCCAKSPAAHAAAIYTLRLRAANTWLATAAALTALTPSVTAAAKARAHAAVMPPQPGLQSLDALGVRLVAARDELIAFADTEPDRYIAAAAWAMTGVAAVAAGPLAGLLGQPAMTRILTAAATDISNGGDPTTAIVDALGTLPDPATVTLDQLPARCRFSPVSFAHPRDWAVAEWAAAAADELARFPTLWSQWLATLTRTFAAGGELVVAVVTQREVPEVLREVTFACFPCQLSASPSETIIAVPANLLAVWEATTPARYRSRPLAAAEARSVLRIYTTLREDCQGRRPLVSLVEAAVNVTVPAA